MWTAAFCIQAGQTVALFGGKLIFSRESILLLSGGVAAFFWFLASGILCASAASEDKKPLDRVATIVAEQILPLVPDAKFDRNPEGFTIKRQTRQFSVPVRLKSGAALPGKVREIEGPKSNGFIVSVRHRNGQYNEPMERGRKPNFERSEFTRRADTDL